MGGTHRRSWAIVIIAGTTILASVAVGANQAREQQHRTFLHAGKYYINVLNVNYAIKERDQLVIVFKDAERLTLSGEEAQAVQRMLENQSPELPGQPKLGPQPRPDTGTPSHGSNGALPSALNGRR